jgi:hypothetical protein
MALSRLLKNLKITSKTVEEILDDQEDNGTIVSELELANNSVSSSRL